MKMLCPASMNISGMVWYEVRLIAFLSQKWATEWTWTLLSLFTNTLVRLAKSWPLLSPTLSKGRGKLTYKAVSTSKQRELIVTVWPEYCFYSKMIIKKLILVCRLALRVKYPKFGTEGFTALYTRWKIKNFKYC